MTANVVGRAYEIPSIANCAMDGVLVRFSLLIRRGERTRQRGGRVPLVDYYLLLNRELKVDRM